MDYLSRPSAVLRFTHAQIAYEGDHVMRTLDPSGRDI